MADKIGSPSKKGGSNGSSKDMFDLPKSLKQKLKECMEAEKKPKEPQVVFLWVCVSGDGLQQGVKNHKTTKPTLSSHEWMTVVDEAASLGANWLVLSFSVPLAECGDIWEVCKWAQDAHGMMVGLHITSNSLTRGEVNLIKQLDLSKTRILAREGVLKKISLREDEKQALVVWAANPQPDGERPNCQGPARMIFVNAHGVLYTCGLVEGKAAYRLGHVFDAKLKRIMVDPNLPHHVHSDIHYVTPECDGCPALIANYFFENATEVADTVK